MQTNETDYWWSGWWRFARTATALAADATACQFNIVQNSGTKLRLYLYIRNQTHNPGLGLSVTEFLTGGTSEGLYSTGASGSPPIIPFDSWTHLTFHVSRSSAAGVYELYVNGVLAMRCAGLPTDGECTAAQLQAQPNLSWPATAGIRAEFCGPVTSYDGTGPALRPMHSLNPATSLIKQAHLCDSASDVANSNGKFWTYIGTSTRTLTTYASSGSIPGRKRWVYSGAAATTWNQTLIDSVGTLPYNAKGWAGIVFPMLYVPSGSAQIVIRNASADAVLTLDIASSLLTKSGVTQAPWTAADRYSLMIHMSSSGAMTGTLSNLTQLNTAVNAWSFDLGAWTPSDIGTITVSGVLGASSSEADGVWIYKDIPCPGVDSLSHVMASTVTPNMAMVNHIASALASPIDAVLVPNPAYPNRIWGMAHRPIACVLGRSGQTRAIFQTNVMDQMTYSRGIEYINCDGGSVNDMVSISDEGSQASALSSLQTNLETMCEQTRARDCTVWMTTMVRRPTGGTWSALQIATMDLYSSIIRTVAASKQSSSLHIRLSDPATAIADHPSLFSVPADYTHPTATGDAEIAKQNVVTYSTPAAPGGIDLAFMLLLRMRR
jgi:hypothetical protein